VELVWVPWQKRPAWGTQESKNWLSKSGNGALMDDAGLRSLLVIVFGKHAQSSRGCESGVNLPSMFEA
jgi:hypothetical protein